MHNIQNQHAFSGDPVNGNPRKPYNDQLACIFESAITASIRQAAQALDRIVDRSRNAVRSPQITVLLDVFGNGFQIGDGAIGPVDPHQERSGCSSHARTSSSGTVSPRSTAARLLFTLRSNHSL